MNYLVVAKAKHTLTLRGVQYKIGDTVPTELTEKEYEFFKDALNVESVKAIEVGCSQFVPKENNENLEVENLLAQLEEARRRIVELESQPKLVAVTSESEVKPKKPYTKKETK